MQRISYDRHRFPPEFIRHPVHIELAGSAGATTIDKMTIL
jgi:hypothetical protein